MREYENMALQRAAHEEVRIPALPHQYLINSGYRLALGSPKGQARDYRRPMRDKRGFHIRDYGDRMTIHWDKKDPSVDLVGHLLEDAPGWALLIGMGAFALSGMAQS